MFELHDEREYVIMLAIGLFIGCVQSKRQRQLLLSRAITELEPHCIDGHILAEAASIWLTIVMVDSPLPVIQIYKQRLMQAIFHIVDSMIERVLSRIIFSMESRCPAKKISIYIPNSSKRLV